MVSLVWGRQKSGLCRGERASYEGGKDELRMVQVRGDGSLLSIKAVCWSSVVVSHQLIHLTAKAES